MNTPDGGNGRRDGYEGPYGDNGHQGPYRDDGYQGPYGDRDQGYEPQVPYAQQQYGPYGYTSVPQQSPQAPDPDPYGYLYRDEDADYSLY